MISKLERMVSVEFPIFMDKGRMNGKMRNCDMDN